MTTRRVGDRVLALTWFGGYADRAVVPAAFAFSLPAGLDDVAAAAIPVNYVTALIALYRMSNLAAGETVLVHGAGGGVGVAATQLAKLRGATVIGTASAAKHKAIRAIGVDHAIDYRTAKVVDEVRRLTNGAASTSCSIRLAAVVLPTATGCSRRWAAWSPAACREWPRANGAASGAPRRRSLRCRGSIRCR